MTVRRLNYTGRRRLKLEDVRVFVSPSEQGPAAFDAAIELSGYDLPADALVSLEAYRQTSWMRFPCGSVGHLEVPANRLLTEFDSDEGILFRLRVTSSASPEGILLAEADKIRPRLTEESDENYLPLLPTKADDNLDEQVFRVDFSDRPLLLINSRCGDWRTLARDPLFVSLAFPAIVREIVTRILHVDKYYDTEDGNEWRSHWLKFCTLLPGMPALPAERDQEKVDDWIDEAVERFCRKFRSFGTFEREYWVKGESA